MSPCVCDNSCAQDGPSGLHVPWTRHSPRHRTEVRGHSTAEPSHTGRCCSFRVWPWHRPGSPGKEPAQRFCHAARGPDGQRVRPRAGRPERPARASQTERTWPPTATPPPGQQGGPSAEAAGATHQDGHLHHVGLLQGLRVHGGPRLEQHAGVPGVVGAQLLGHQRQACKVKARERISERARGSGRLDKKRSPQHSRASGPRWTLRPHRGGAEPAECPPHTPAWLILPGDGRPFPQTVRRAGGQMGTQSGGGIWEDAAAALLGEEHLSLLRAGPEPELHSLPVWPVGACSLTDGAFPHSQGSPQAQDSRGRLPPPRQGLQLPLGSCSCQSPNWGERSVARVGQTCRSVRTVLESCVPRGLTLQPPKLRRPHPAHSLLGTCGVARPVVRARDFAQEVPTQGAQASNPPDLTGTRDAPKRAGYTHVRRTGSGA